MEVGRNVTDGLHWVWPMFSQACTPLGGTDTPEPFRLTEPETALNEEVAKQLVSL